MAGLHRQKHRRIFTIFYLHDTYALRHFHPVQVLFFSKATLGERSYAPQLKNLKKKKICTSVAARVHSKEHPQNKKNQTHLTLIDCSTRHSRMLHLNIARVCLRFFFLFQFTHIFFFNFRTWVRRGYNFVFLIISFFRSRWYGAPYVRTLIQKWVGLYHRVCLCFSSKPRLAGQINALHDDQSQGLPR